MAINIPFHGIRSHDLWSFPYRFSSIFINISDISKDLIFSQLQIIISSIGGSLLLFDVIITWICIRTVGIGETIIITYIGVRSIPYLVAGLFLLIILFMWECQRLLLQFFFIFYHSIFEYKRLLVIHYNLGRMQISSTSCGSPRRRFTVFFTELILYSVSKSISFALLLIMKRSTW